MKASDSRSFDSIAANLVCSSHTLTLISVAGNRFAVEFRTLKVPFQKLVFVRLQDFGIVFVGFLGFAGMVL